jgi:pimeloyl-ACP methyl ester carboxylesterase
LLFAHSYGGLIALETATRSAVFDRMALYEPGVSIHGSIPVAWMPRYRELLDSGDGRAAFAYFAQQAGHAPWPTAKLPLWYMRAVMRIVIRREQWNRFEPLLQANLAEHEQIARLDSSIARYEPVTAEVLLLGGSRSPAFMTTEPFEMLQGTIRRTSVEILDGLNHHAPDERAPEVVARRVLTFMKFSGDPRPESP